MTKATKESAKKAPADKFGLSGSRTRVSVFLPVQKDTDALAALGVLKYLQGQLNAELPVRGFTSSRLRPAVYQGSWYDEKGDEEAGVPPGWCEEAVIHVILDYVADMETSKEFQKAMHALRKKAAETYAKYGRPQKEFWLMVQPLVQLVNLATVE